jgi:hypothetical protein
MRRVLLLVALASPLAWLAYGSWLGSTMPKVEIHELAPLAAASDKTLPFFELMSPLPELAGTTTLPKLEYKKGPPERFLERIVVLFEKQQGATAKERVVYYGRHTRTDLYGLSLLPGDQSNREARYVELALRASQGQDVPELTGLKGFLFRPFFLREASRLLDGIESVAIMDQAGTPAFLFTATPTPEGRTRASALFARRNSFYRVDYLGDRGFALVDPEALFRKSFLTERRSDALEYVARNLSEVHLDSSRQSGMRLPDLAWPMLLLAANLSVDPSSIDSYFHFAGLNALLYKAEAQAGDSQDLEIADALRNNVLTSDLYARDVAPESPKSTEIARFARLLTRNFDQ